jgi:hypothetical protein
LEDAMPSAVRAATIALTELVYRDTSDWYQPGYQIDVNEAQRHQIQRVLNAFTFGNPQLLIQQIALSRTLAGEVVGQEGHANVRRGPNAYQHSEIQLVGEQSVRLLRSVSGKCAILFQRRYANAWTIPKISSGFSRRCKCSRMFCRN